MRVLNQSQSEARIRKLRAQGYHVNQITLPDGTVVVTKNPKRGRKSKRKSRRKNPCECGPNPLMHFPKLKGRGRPAIKRKWDIVIQLKNGKIAERRISATKPEATSIAQALLRKKFHGSPVSKVVLDDGK